MDTSGRSRKLPRDQFLKTSTYKQAQWRNKVVFKTLKRLSNVSTQRKKKKKEEANTIRT